MNAERRIEGRSDGANIPERPNYRHSKTDTFAVGAGIGETLTLAYGLSTGDWLLATIAASAGFLTVCGVAVKDVLDLRQRFQELLETAPKPTKPPRIAKYQPNSFNTPNSQTAIYLADVPVGDYVKVYPKTGRLKDKFRTETNIAKIIEVKETPQKGNEMVIVQIDGWMDRKVSLAAGTAAVRLSQ